MGPKIMTPLTTKKYMLRIELKKTNKVHPPAQDPEEIFRQRDRMDLEEVLVTSRKMS